MGTREQEFESGCFAKAREGELMFVVLERDPHAAATVRFWADRAELAGKRPEKVLEARQLADKMEASELRRMTLLDKIRSSPSFPGLVEALQEERGLVPDAEWTGAFDNLLKLLGAEVDQ